MEPRSEVQISRFTVNRLSIVLKIDLGPKSGFLHFWAPPAPPGCQGECQGTPPRPGDALRSTSRHPAGPGAPEVIYITYILYIPEINEIHEKPPKFMIFDQKLNFSKITPWRFWGTLGIPSPPETTCGHPTASETRSAPLPANPQVLELRRPKTTFFALGFF